jgi:hypothetical protein
MMLHEPWRRRRRGGVRWVPSRVRWRVLRWSISGRAQSQPRPARRGRWPAGLRNNACHSPEPVSPAVDTRVRLAAERRAGRAVATRKRECVAPIRRTENPAVAPARAQAGNVVTPRTAWRADRVSRAVRRHPAAGPPSAVRRTCSARAGSACRGAQRQGSPVVRLVSRQRVARPVRPYAAPTANAARLRVWVNAAVLAQRLHVAGAGPA